MQNVTFLSENNVIAEFQDVIWVLELKVGNFLRIQGKHEYYKITKVINVIDLTTKAISIEVYLEKPY